MGKTLWHHMLMALNASSKFIYETPSHIVASSYYSQQSWYPISNRLDEFGMEAVDYKSWVQ